MRRFLALFPAGLLVVLFVPTLAGCPRTTCDPETCNGNTRHFCVFESDPDGGSAHMVDEACPEGTTCALDAATSPSCFLSPAAACTAGEQACQAGLPSTCDTHADGTLAFAADEACDDTSVCALVSTGAPQCVSAAMDPCAHVGDAGCSRGQPSTCIALDDGSLVLDALAAPCGAGTVCTVLDGPMHSGADCARSPTVPCDPATFKEACEGDAKTACLPIGPGRSVLFDSPCSRCMPNPNVNFGDALLCF